MDKSVKSAIAKVLSDKAIVKAHPETGDVITYFQNDEGETFGKVRVDQSAPVINNGFMSFANRSAFITYDEDTCKRMAPILVAEQPYPIEGKVQVLEQLEPFYKDQEPKTKGSEGATVTHQGAPVYRDTNFVFDLDAKDVLLRGDRESDVQASVEETATEDVAE